MLKKNWVQTIAENPNALKRLQEILNSTETSDDGERLFVSIEDAAEVYAILFTARTADLDQLDALVNDVRDGKPVISATSLCRLKFDADEGSFVAGPLDGEGDLNLVIDVY